MRSGRDSMGLQETPWSILAISPDNIPVKICGVWVVGGRYGPFVKYWMQHWLSPLG